MRQENRDHDRGETRKYLITFTCYGAWRHDPEGGYGSKSRDLDAGFEKTAADFMSERPYVLDQRRRRVVLDAIRHCCRCRSWHLYAAHVRSTRVHAVVQGDRAPDLVLNAFKAYASRALNNFGMDAQKQRWARGGSARYLRTDESLTAAIEYVVYEQGPPMAVFGV